MTFPVRLTLTAQNVKTIVFTRDFTLNLAWQCIRLPAPRAISLETILIHGLRRLVLC